MATNTYTVAPVNTNGSTFYAWAHPIAAFMATAGWVQQGDTGQVVWPVSIVNIASVATAGGGTQEVYTYTLSQGPALQVNSTVIIKGCTTSGLNGTFIITALGAGTFTVTNATNVSESETAGAAWGSIDVRVTISNAIGNGTSNTYTFAAFDGALIIGQSVVVTGCSTSGFNNTFTIASINVGAGTFTTTSTNAISHASEAETAVGLVTATPAVVSSGASTNTTMPPAATSSFYEIWKMNDGVGLPIYLKIGYGASTSSVLDVQLIVTMCTGTDGAGNATGGSTGAQNVTVAAANSASTFPSYLSGSTNRMQIALFSTNTAASIPGFMSVERSHDASGNDTASFATLCIASNGVCVQISISSTANTFTETRFPTVSTIGTNTGSFGGSTILSPVFPLVGAINNPMLGFLVGKHVDWVDQTQFSFTMYNTAHNYITFNTTGSSLVGAGAILYQSTSTCCLMMRYE